MKNNRKGNHRERCDPPAERAREWDEGPFVMLVLDPARSLYLAARSRSDVDSILRSFFQVLAFWSVPMKSPRSAAHSTHFSLSDRAQSEQELNGTFCLLVPDEVLSDCIHASTIAERL